MAPLAISLFSGFRIAQGGLQLTHPLSAKGRALLAYLAIEIDRPHSRSTLAALLWPEQPEAASRSNLRQSLHRLRQAIGDDQGLVPYLRISSQEIQFNCESDYRLDVAEFNQAVSACQRHHRGDSLLCEDCLERLRFAVDLYKGDLLSGFSLTGCRQFEWWLLGKQEQYHHQALEILDHLERNCELNQDYSLASRYAQRAIEIEPWRELAHRQRMRVLALSGQRCDALHQYEVCCRILAKELGVPPNAATTRLYQQIRTGSGFVD